MKFEKTTLMICIAVVLAISGIMGYIFMNNSRKGTEVMVSSAENNASIYVHVKGEVKKPGLYEFSYGDRVNDAVLKAGGVTENGDVERINLAKALVDGTEVVVPNKNDDSGVSNGKININTADEKVLQNISGVGESTAEKIIKYREENGGFDTIEEIMNIDGIGLKTFDTIKDDITVN